MMCYNERFPPLSHYISKNQNPILLHKTSSSFSISPQNSTVKRDDAQDLHGDDHKANVSKTTSEWQYRYSGKVEEFLNFRQYLDLTKTYILCKLFGIHSSLTNYTLYLSCLFI